MMKYDSLEAMLQGLSNEAWNRANLAMKKAEREEARFWHEKIRQALRDWSRHSTHSKVEPEPECQFCVLK